MKNYSLSEFNLLIKKTLNNSLKGNYWIVAEIGQINGSSKGHCYLDLVEKDNDSITAKTRATIWAGTFGKLHDWFMSITGTPLKQGMKILLNGCLEYHEVYGLCINIKDIDANFTLGEREREKKDTILRLQSEGVFDMNKSLILPCVIQRVAVISSENAAGYEDFINQFSNNQFGYQSAFQLYNSVMQGEQASASIIDSLERIYEQESEYDAVVIIRGGGSQIDLDCFDDYELCSYIAQFPLPVICGIGHERDTSTADKVANTTLKTPTSVAEYLLSKMMSYEAEIKGKVDYIINRSRQMCNNHSQNLFHLNQMVKFGTERVLNSRRLALQLIASAISNKPSVIIKHKAIALASLRKLITAYDPANTIRKGYSITRMDGKLLTNQKIEIGAKLETTTCHAVATSIVYKIK